MIIFLIILAVLLVLWAVFTYFSVKLSVIRPKSDEVDFEKLSEKHKIRYEIRKKNNQHLYDMKPEDLTLTDPMGNTLKAWFVPGRETKKFVICVHGYKCNGPDEFSHMLPFYHDTLGYNYLLPDHAAHGRSTGKHIGFGSYESKNLLLWVDYLRQRFGSDISIVLHGISMGAATVMLANESDPPEQVKAVVLDDAPLVYDKFSLATKVLVGNYVKGSIFLGRKEKQAYNNILWVDSNYPDAFLLGSEYYVDMREMDSALTSANTDHALVDPLAERNLQMQHCFIASERENDVAKDAFDRMMIFLKPRVQ